MLACGAVSAQTPPPPASQNPPTREEYDKLKQEQDQMRQEMLDLRQQLQQERAARSQTPPPANAVAPATPAQPAKEYATVEDTDDIEKQVKAIRSDLERNRFGTSQFHLAGDGAVGYTAQRSSKSTFDAGIAPLILWQPESDILIETGFDIGVSTDDGNNSSTSFDLTLANISFLVNDYLYVGGGLFVVPFSVYHRHFDPPWINKFPDDPLPFGDAAIAPSSEVGLFLGGAVPIQDMKLTYDVFLTNGPNLYTANTDSANAGQLNFDDFTDLNNGKAVGGRIGFLPWPNIEVGYSAMFAQVNPDHFSNTDAFLQAVDLNWRQDVDAIKGQIDFRTEWVWSHVSRATYDGGGGGGPISFGNDRYGGYVQLCFRPTKVDNKFIRNLELVSRYDILHSSDSAPGGDREQRIAVGVDYWITPAIVLKTAYECDHKKNGTDQNAFMAQLGFGL